MTEDIERLITIPEDKVSAVGRGVIFKRSEQYSKGTGEGGIIIASSDDGLEKKYMLGEVVAVGKDVEEVKRGDVIVVVKQTVHRIPNGTHPPVLFKTEENAMAIIAVLPNDPDSVQDAGIGKAETRD
jgi:co-chaperonin GroES (HSP10)